MAKHGPIIGPREPTLAAELYLVVSLVVGRKVWSNGGGVARGNFFHTAPLLKVYQDAL